MCKGAMLLSLIVSASIVPGSAALGAEAPTWAYPINPPGLTEAPDNDMPLRVPGSDATFTMRQINDLFFAPDWHPSDHPPMPDIVSKGRKPEVRACGSCHRTDGSGGPENARIAGLPVDYFVQQMEDFKSGARKSSVPGREPVEVMDHTAKAISKEDAASAAAYFSAIKPSPAISVIEAEQAPKTKVTGWHLAIAPEGGTEPIGQRIIEVPDNLEYFTRRDGRARFRAYVPPGSLRKGQQLVDSESGACRACHGPDLKGLDAIPGIAGRSPSYLMRQLHDFQTGARAGTGGDLMTPIVEKLSTEQLLAIAAYVASLNP